MSSTAFLLGAFSLYGAAAQLNGWWPWTKWVSYRRHRVSVAKAYVIQRDYGLPWYAFPWAVLHPNGGCCGVAMTYWGAMRILRRVTGIPDLGSRDA